MAQRVLLVDDSEFMRDLLKGFLEHHGFEVSVEVDGTRALTAFRAARLSGTPFDIVLTDVDMPLMGGDDLHRAIKDELGRCRFFAMTSACAKEIKEYFTEQGVTILNKNGSPTIMVAQLQD